MSTKYRFRSPDIPHFITLTLVEWIDLFSREKYKEMAIENLQFCVANKGLIVHAYVIMTNHIHLIVSSNGKDLAAIIKNYKRHMAKSIFNSLQCNRRESRRNWMIWILKSQGKKSSSNKNIKVWRHENHPVALVTNKMQEHILDYVHNNPIKAGICYTPEDYKYSSAGVYAGEVGVMDVSLLD